VEVDVITYDTKACHETGSATVKKDKIYPFQAQSVSYADLPFIDAAEVTKRNGEDGRRLCKYTFAKARHKLSVHAYISTPYLTSSLIKPGIVVDTTVLDVTQYICTHPGGQQIIRGFGGQDCSWQWWTFHNRKVWNDVAATLRVGRTEGIENRHVKPKAFVGLRGLGCQEDLG
jgi:hypothetical protein